MALDKALVTRVFARDKWKCRHCKDRIVHPHHVIYKSQGGVDELWNLLSLCLQCHRAAHDGHLLITVLEVLDDDVSVRFTRVGNWKPT
jgi:hypothetical protein